MGLRFKDKKAFVTASTRGLGFAVAQYLASEGAHVVVTGRRESEAQSAAEKIREQGGEAHGIALDVMSPTQIVSTIEAAAETMGGMDILVTNAGGPPIGDFGDLTDQDWMSSFELTLLSVIRLVRAAEPHLARSEAPRIVSMLSSSFKQPIEHLATSNVLRPGVAGLVKQLAIEFAPKILVNGVAPGRFGTDRVQANDEDRARRRGISKEQQVRETEAQIPLGRYGDPKELARVIGFLASEENTYMTGQVLIADGGFVRAL